jgi:hypothetical protein
VKRRLGEHIKRVREGLAVRFLGALVRERQRIQTTISSTEGMMSLLMKARNGQRWTAEDRKHLLTYLRKLSTVSPYLMVLALPGSYVLLPVVAWWLDRRYEKRRMEESREAKRP